MQLILNGTAFTAFFQEKIDNYGHDANETLVEDIQQRSGIFLQRHAGRPGDVLFVPHAYSSTCVATRCQDDRVSSFSCLPHIVSCPYLRVQLRNVKTSQLASRSNGFYYLDDLTKRQTTGNCTNEFEKVVKYIFFIYSFISWSLYKTHRANQSMDRTPGTRHQRRS